MPCHLKVLNRNKLSISETPFLEAQERKQDEMKDNETGVKLANRSMIKVKPEHHAG